MMLLSMQVFQSFKVKFAIINQNIVKDMIGKPPNRIGMVLIMMIVFVHSNTQSNLEALLPSLLMDPNNRYSRETYEINDPSVIYFAFLTMASAVLIIYIAFLKADLHYKTKEKRVLARPSDRTHVLLFLGLGVMGSIFLIDFNRGNLHIF